MARAWRIEYEGAPYHVLSRGNEKQDIFILLTVLLKVAGKLKCDLDLFRIKSLIKIRHQPWFLEKVPKKNVKKEGMGKAGRGDGVRGRLGERERGIKR